MNSKSQDERAIRSVINEWATATREGRKNDILAGHDPRSVIFDVLKPIQYHGTVAYRRGWARWQPPFEIPSVFKLEQLKVVTSREVAFCHGLIRCGGKLPSGERFQDRVRATLCLQKKRGKWRVVHQHISMPMVKGDRGETT